MSRTLFLLTLILTLAVGCMPGAGFKLQSGPSITIAADALVNDDLYLVGGQIRFEGPVGDDLRVAVVILPSSLKLPAT